MRSPEEVRDYLRTIAGNYAAAEITRGQYGAMVGHLTEACNGDGVLRRKLIGWIFGIGDEMSTKYLKPGEIMALITWIDAYEEDGHWHPSVNFLTEVRNILLKIKRL